jgi:hypothetical protein
MELTEWARANDVHPELPIAGSANAACRPTREGWRLTPPWSTRMVVAAWLGRRAVVYARVSAHDQRAYLDGQVTQLPEWATGQRVRLAEDGSARNAGGACNRTMRAMTCAKRPSESVAEGGDGG